MTQREHGARPVPLLLAHRGDWRRSPENSLAAVIAGAAAPGMDGVEFDVRRSRDGVPVVIHDDDLRRVQHVDRRVADLDAGELERLGVPTLADVLAGLPRRAFLDVELKVMPDRATVEVLAAGRGPDLARAVVSSFLPEALSRMGELAPRWPRWLIVEEPLDAGVVERAIALGCAGISAAQASLDGRRVALARAAGLQVAAWTVRRVPTLLRLQRLGVDAICVEGPALRAAAGADA